MCNGSSQVEGAPHILDRTGRKQLPIGIESFADIARSFVYVDKTLVVRELVNRRGVTLFCRPRRFGKSTALRMMRAFFELPVDGYVPDVRDIFQDLAIWSQGEHYRAECGAHPVIYLSLGGCGRGSYDATLAGIARQIADEFHRHRYLYDKHALFPLEMGRFEALATGTATPQQLLSSLAWLASLLRDFHNGQQTVILIDEYDTPINDGYINGYRNKILDFYRGWLTDALKGTDALYCAALTGVLRVSQESIFSELNNVRVDTTLNERFEEAFGFTDSEVAALATYMNQADSIDEMRAWYDGYRFGTINVYNPWSVNQYLDEHVAQPYWTNTSQNGIVTKLIARADEQTSVELALLSAGETVAKPIDLQTVFDDLDQNPEAVWSQLYQAGYVTTDDTQTPNDSAIERRLRVPNLEVRKLFQRELLNRSLRFAGARAQLDRLHQSLVSVDQETFIQTLSAILRTTPSYHDLRSERDYHVLMLGLLYAVPGYRPALSNRESGDGRCDVLLEPLPERTAELPAIAMELKRLVGADDEALAKNAHDVALGQAKRLGYGTGLRGNGAWLWGVSFCGKHAAAACERVRQN